MKIAVISDIHSNLAALQAVLADIEQRQVDEIICLGDVLGYGPNPRECLDLIMERCSVCLCGNHDQAVFYEPSNFNVAAETACYWTRRELEQDKESPNRKKRWEFLGKLPVRHEIGQMLFVHGSPRRPVNEYLFPEDAYSNPSKLISNFERMNGKQACFVGHTHVPGVFYDDPYFEPPDELTEPFRYEVCEFERAIINVGSVGQPRDRDPRASYVTITDDLVEFLRVEYQVEQTADRIRSNGELDQFLAERLIDGR
jgi:predicted phosphodiesterase